MNNSAHVIQSRPLWHLLRYEFDLNSQRVYNPHRQSSPILGKFLGPDGEAFC
jgi:hypothetical protein